MKKETVIINNKKITGYSGGSGETALFMIHGNSCSAGIFRNQFESSLADEFRLAAINLPGHGDSEPAGPGGYTFPALGDVIISAAEALNLENTIYIGHSFGGHLLLQNADRLPRCRGLIVFGASPFSLPPRFDLAFLPNPAANSFFNADINPKQLDGWASSLVAEDRKPADFMSEDLKNADPNFRARIGRYIAEGDLRDEIELAGKLGFRPAVIHGLRDRIVSTEYMESLPPENFWKGSVHFIDCGHSPQVEVPEEFDSIIREYSASLKDVY